MKSEHITLVQEQFSPMHLLRLVETVKAIDNKAFTSAVAEAMRLINNPPVIIGSDLKINIPGDR